jgi:hypothetical protein
MQRVSPVERQPDRDPLNCEEFLLAPATLDKSLAQPFQCRRFCNVGRFYLHGHACPHHVTCALGADS